jgi:hypothetical protein
MAERVPGKHANILRETSGQVSAKYHELLWRTCSHTEIVPKILASTPKSAKKI